MKAHVSITLSPPVWDAANAQENPKSLDYSCFDEAMYIIAARGDWILGGDLSLPWWQNTTWLWCSTLSACGQKKHIFQFLFASTQIFFLFFFPTQKSLHTHKNTSPVNVSGLFNPPPASHTLSLSLSPETPAVFTSSMRVTQTSSSPRLSAIIHNSRTKGWPTRWYWGMHQF